MKSRIEKLVPEAIEEAAILKDNGSDKIPSEYNGYISSFGASVIQSGLIPAVAFYSNESSKSDKDKKKLLVAIGKIIPTESSLLEYVCKAENKNLYTKDLILDIATALKLAIRTYELVEKDKK